MRTVYCVAVAIFILSLLLNCISISMRGAEHRFVINMMLLWKLKNICLLFTLKVAQYIYFANFELINNVGYNLMCRKPTSF